MALRRLHFFLSGVRFFLAPCSDARIISFNETRRRAGASGETEMQAVLKAFATFALGLAFMALMFGCAIAAGIAAFAFVLSGADIGLGYLLVGAALAGMVGYGRMTFRDFIGACALSLITGAALALLIGG